MPWPILAFEIVKDIVFPEIESFINRRRERGYTDEEIKVSFQARWMRIVNTGQIFLDATAPPTPPSGPQ